MPAIAVPARPGVPTEPGWVGEAVGVGPITHPRTGVLPLAPRALPASTLVVASLAIVALVVALLLLSLGNFVADQFARSAVLGSVTLVILLAAAGALLWAAWREWRGVAQLATVEAIRADLAGEDVARARTAALAWCDAVGVREAEAEALKAAADSATVRGMLEVGVLARLDTAAAAAGREAALQVLTATAISPSPGLDGVIMVWRGARLVRQVASLYGFRPGTLGTLALVRRVAIDAGTVAAADIAVGAMVESLAHDAVLGRLLGQAAGAATATRRTLRLARAVADACRPLPRKG